MSAIDLSPAPAAPVGWPEAFWAARSLSALPIVAALGARRLVAKGENALIELRRCPL